MIYTANERADNIRPYDHRQVTSQRTDVLLYIHNRVKALLYLITVETVHTSRISKEISIYPQRTNVLFLIITHKALFVKYPFDIQNMLDLTLQICYNVYITPQICLSYLRGDRVKIYLAVFAAGGILYSLMEIAWRGYTHISMALAGGLCLVGMFCIERRYGNLPLWVKCSLGALLITAVELVFGCVVNKAMGLSVWDYSDRAFNILGQICPLFSAVWFVVSFPAFFICRKINRLIGEADDQ